MKSSIALARRAEPTHVDTTVTFYILAAILFASRKEPLWLVLCCFLASLSVANGVGLAVFWFSALFFLERNRKWIFFVGLSLRPDEERAFVGRLHTGWSHRFVEKERREDTRPARREI